MGLRSCADISVKLIRQERVYPLRLKRAGLWALCKTYGISGGFARVEECLICNLDGDKHGLHFQGEKR